LKNGDSATFDYESMEEDRFNLELEIGDLIYD